MARALPHLGTTRRMLRLGVIGLVVLALASMATFWIEVKHNQRALTDGRADNVQWTVGQALVEAMALDVALSQALAAGGTAPSLVEVRRRYDVLYNRMDILAVGSIYRHLLEDDDYRQSFTLARQRLEALTSRIDAENAVLAADLPELAADARTLGQTVRAFSTRGVHVYDLYSDGLRERLDRLMANLVWVAAALVSLLLVLTAILLRQSRLAEERLVAQTRTSARLKTILRTSNDAIFVVGMDGRIASHNGAASSLFSLTEATAQDRVLRGLLCTDIAHWHPKRLIGQADVPMQAQSLDGRRFPVEVSVDWVEIDDSPNLVVFIRDVSVQKAAEAELIDARDRALAGERAKANFVAVMSHELRTPLNGILGMLNLLRDTPLTGQQCDYLERMETSGQMLLASVDDVLDISRSAERDVQVSPVATEIAPLLAQIIDSQTGAAANRGNRLRFDMLTDLPAAMLVDPGRLQQVLLNLVGNAIKFTEDGDILVEAEVLEGPAPHLELRVADTGIGIREEDLARVFEDFETGDASMARAQMGAGLGLAIVRRIVAAMDGQIAVESLPGEGTLFTVTLPIVAAAGTAAPPPRPARPAPIASALDVLVVEDNPVNRAVLSGLLGRRGARVTEAPSAAEGVALAAGQSFDLILMDLSMPGIDGVEAARQIRASGGRSAQAPIYAVTAYAGVDPASLPAAAGLQGVLTKPLVPAEIDALLAGTAAVAPVLHTDHLAVLAEDLGRPALADLLDRFTAEAQAETAALARAEGLAAPEVARRAHRLAGAAQNFGVRRFAAALRALEAAASADPAQIPDAAQAVPQVWADAAEALTAWRAASLRDQTA